MRGDPDPAQQRALLRERLEILDALVAAVDRRHEVLDVVAGTATPEEAVPRLAELLACTEIGARAVLDAQVRRFAAGERARLHEARDAAASELAALGTVGTVGHSKPLVVGRGLLLVERFCEATGLTRAEVEPLLADGRVEGVYLENGQWHGLFDDVLPTREELLGWGLGIDPAYDPELLRSHDGPADDDPDDDEPGDDSWTLRW